MMTKKDIRSPANAPRGKRKCEVAVQDREARRIRGVENIDEYAEA